MASPVACATTVTPADCVRRIAAPGLLAMTLLLIPGTALAATFNLPGGPLPNNCSASGNTVTCTDDVDLEEGDEVIVDGPIDWEIQGDFSADEEVSVNTSGVADDLNIDATGDVEIGEESRVNANVSAGGDVSVDEEGSIGGNVSADGDVSVDEEGSIGGDVISGGEVEVEDDGTINGCVSAATITDGGTINCNRDLALIASRTTLASGDSLTLAVAAQNCDGVDADRWRNTWSDLDSLGVPNSGQQTPTMDSPCDNPPTRTFTVSADPATYTVDFESEWCEDGVAGGSGNVFECPTNQSGGTQFSTFGTDSIEIEVIGESAPSPAMELRMEEQEWDGTADEVADSSNNGNDGTSQNGASTAIETPGPAIPGNPGTCRYGDFDGSNDFVRVPHDSSLEMSDNDSVTVTAWVRKASTQSGWIAIAQKSDTSYNLQLANGNEPTFTIHDGTWNEGRSGVSLDVGQWYHLAGTYDGNEVRIYIDGELEGTVTASGNMTDASSFDVGIGENLDQTGRHFDGQIDEVRIYDQALSETQVATVATATHPCGSLLTEYRMDEASWTGDPAEVTDRTGNGHDATAVGGSTTDGADPARPGSVGTCRYGTLDGTNDGVDDDDAGSYLNGLSAVTITGWVYNTDDLNGNDRGIFFTGDPAPGKDHRLGIRYDSAGANGGGNNLIKAGVQTTACSDSEDCVQVETESDVMKQDQWQHVAMTWESGGDLRVYVDGTDVTGDGTGDLGQGTGGNLDAVNGLNIGQGAKGQRWQGRIDEFRVYSAALAQTEIQQIFQDTHPCADAGLDHFRLVHDGAGINCRAEDVVLRAEDASGNRVTDYTGSVDLSTTTGNGDWTIGTGNGSLAGGSGDDGSAEYTFVDADDGEVALSYSNTHAETLNIDANDGGVSDDDTEGDITFRPWGFEFDPDPIPTQIAGRPFGLTLTAVGELPSDPGCNTIEEYDGDRDVKFWFDYEDPGSGTVAVSVDETAIESSSTAATAQTITFSNGSATVPVDYRDAGEIQLHARDDIGVGEPPSGDTDELVSGGAIGGGTNPFVVRPFGFYVDFDPDGDTTFDDRGNNPGCGAQTSCATDASGDVFATAGESFSARIAAVVWQSGDDDGNGRPDGNAILADNDVTPNFGQESDAETVDIADTLVAPMPGTDGILANAMGIGGFNGGVSTVTDLRYSEVGIINLAATLSDTAYLGTVDVTGAVSNVGRFVPADFRVDLRERGMYAATCDFTFTYIGQAFGYDTLPRLDIIARNANGTTTRNYRDGFMKLAADDVNVTPSTSDASATGNVSGNTDVAVSPSPASLNTGTVEDNGDGDPLGNGRIVYTFSGDDRYTYDKVHNARIGPFEAVLPINFDSVTDGDGVTEAAADSLDSLTPRGVELRFGRLVIDDAFGPEVAPVEQRWQIETWQGANWETNVDDGCTSLALASDVQLDGDAGAQPGNLPVTLNDNGGSGTTEITSGSIDFASGTATVIYDEPGAGERGWIGVASTLGGGHHLLIDDNDDGGEDGPYDTNPSARVTFGVFAGESEHIYLREVFPAP